MKAILKFKLPDEQSEFDLANNAGKMYSILWDFDQWLRSEIKYDSGRFTPEEQDLLDRVRTKLYDFFNDYNFRWDE